jgi:hypothetical protein
MPYSRATIELWLKLSSVSAGAIVSRGTGSNENSVRLKTAQGNVHVSFTRIGGVAASLITGTGVLPTNQWTHIAAVNNNSTITLYINGTFVMSSGGGSLGQVAADLYVGKNTPNESSFNGTIDDLRWWTVARTASEVCTDAGGTPATVDGATTCSLP